MTMPQPTQCRFRPAKEIFAASLQIDWTYCFLDFQEFVLYEFEFHFRAILESFPAGVNQIGELQARS